MMVVMDEAVVVMMIAGLWLMAGYIAYLKLWVVRRQRRRIESLTDDAIAVARSAPKIVANAEDGEDMKRIQRRLEVLERIAVDKEHSLSREIDELRVVGR